jgi:hypothetical protein
VDTSGTGVVRRSSTQKSTIMAEQPRLAPRATPVPSELAAQTDLEPADQSFHPHVPSRSASRRMSSASLRDRSLPPHQYMPATSTPIRAQSRSQARASAPADIPVSDSLADALHGTIRPSTSRKHSLASIYRSPRTPTTGQPAISTQKPATDHPLPNSPTQSRQSSVARHAAEPAIMLPPRPTVSSSAPPSRRPVSERPRIQAIRQMLKTPDRDLADPDKPLWHRFNVSAATPFIERLMEPGQVYDEQSLWTHVVRLTSDLCWNSTGQTGSISES